MQSIELKVKLKHLAEESRIIRREAEKQYEARNFQKGNDLTCHRKEVVRPEARATHLAYQFLRGIPYEVVERYNDDANPPNWKRVEAMVKKYGGQDFDWKEWLYGEESSRREAVGS